MDEVWVALIGAALGVICTLVLKKRLGRRQSTTVESPAKVAETVTADLHEAAVEHVDADHASRMGEVEEAVTAPRPASALAALLNRMRGR